MFSEPPGQQRAEGCSERTLRLTQTGRERKGGLTTDGEVPDPGKGVTRGTEEPPQTLAPASPLVCPPPPPGLLGSRGPRLTARRDPARLFRDRDEMGQGRPRILRGAPQPSRELEAAVPPPLPISGHVINLHAGSLSGGEGESLIDAGRRGKVSPEGVSRTGRGGASVARRLT